MSNRVQVVTLSELPADSPMPLLTRRRVMADKMMVSDIQLKRGFKVQTHSHENEQISIVLSGRLRFTLEGGVTHDVSAGMTIVLPGGVPHAAEAIDDVHVLDLFSPPSAGTGIDQRR